MMDIMMVYSDAQFYRKGEVMTWTESLKLTKSKQ